MVPQAQVPRSFPESQSAIFAGSAWVGLAGLLFERQAKALSSPRKYCQRRSSPARPSEMRFGIRIAATDWDLAAPKVQAANADKDRQDFGSESFPFRR